MGSCLSCGGSKPAEKDPDDKFMDDIEIKETKVEDFDNVFSSCSDPLNTLVELNNALMTAEQDVKEAIHLSRGAIKLQIKIGGNIEHGLAVESDSGDKPGDELLKAAREKESIMNAEREANEAKALLDKVMAAQSGLPPAKLKFGRIMFEKPEDAPLPKDVAAAVAGYNAALFKLRKAVMMMNGEFGLGKAVSDCLDLIKKEAKGAIKLSFELDEETGAPKLSFGNFKAMDTLPPPVKACWDAVQSLIAAVQTAAKAVPTLMEQIQAIADQASELKDKGADICKEAELPPLEIPRCLRNVGQNLQSLSRALAVCKTLGENVKQIGDDMKKAVEGATD